MPGFNFGSSIGKNTYPSIIEPKYKFRWKFIFYGSGEELLLEKCKRPTVKWNEKALRYGHETSYHAADVVWEPLTITIYDTEDIDATKLLITKYPNVYSQGNGFVGRSRTTEDYYKRRAILHMLDAQGLPIEEWILYGTWIQSINFGELAYISSDIQKIDVTLRFDRAEYKTIAR